MLTLSTMASFCLAVIMEVGTTPPSFILSDFLSLRWAPTCLVQRVRGMASLYFVGDADEVAYTVVGLITRTVRE